jgi:hypothetical protein
MTHVVRQVKCISLEAPAPRESPFRGRWGLLTRHKSHGFKMRQFGYVIQAGVHLQRLIFFQDSIVFGSTFDKQRYDKGERVVVT